MKRFPVLVIVTLLVAILQPIQAGWMRTYGGESDDEGQCVQQTSDRGYIVTGRTTSFGAGQLDLWLLKTDSDGDTLWTRPYGGDEHDYGGSVRETSDGSYIVIGNTFSFGAGDWDIWLLKVNPEGDTLWTRTYGGEAREGGSWVEELPDGGYIVAGGTKSFGAGDFDGWLLKLDANGDTLWTRIYGEAGFDFCWCVQQTPDGGYIITGGSGPDAPHSDLWLLKTDAEGDPEWSKVYGKDQKDYGHGVLQTADGGYIIVGYRDFTPSCTFGNLWLLKTDAAGDTIWTRTYGGDSKADRGDCIQRTNDGNYIITGWTRSFSTDVADLWLLKVDAKGDTLWTRTFGGEAGEWGTYVQPTSDTGYIITGYTYSFGAGGSDLWLIKTDSLGQVAVSEEPAEDKINWEVTTPIGTQVVLRYEDRPQGFTASVFDSLGRKVDEVHATESSGMITWGKCYGPGVYFIVPSEGKASVQKVVLIK